MHKHLKRYRYHYSSVVMTVLLTWYYLALPNSLFQSSYATVVEARDGQLLAAAIAPDGQWRFPEMDSVPDKFSQALVYFEDEYFHYHPGFNPVSLLRAAGQNLSSGKVISGGSTITMQLVRLMRKNKPRTLWQKVIEIILATRIELSYSKDQIIALYASHAPFGGNVVGLSSATWRYFGRHARNLSWGEAALLAVLPNSPALIHPGRNRNELRAKRNKLLKKLQIAGVIDPLTRKLAEAEAIPEAPVALPRLAPHLLTRAINDGRKQQRIRSTVNADLQRRVAQIVKSHHRVLSGNEVHNAAVIVAEVNSGKVLAYIGNVPAAGQANDSQVDIITAPRSTGSILKPFLYAAALDEGQLLPSTLVADVPLFINGFAPQNFSRSFDGAVSADKALSRSLNVPAVQILREYRYEKLHALLKKLGMTTLDYNADHYGLALILGGAEGTLWDISGMYAGFGRTLNHYTEHHDAFKYSTKNFGPLTYTNDQLSKPVRLKTGILSAASIYHTMEALLEVNRPTAESSWQAFNSSQKIAWKTGTSFGYRDAWAVGLTAKYVVGVWVGNADGEGRPGLVGIEAAAPLMFDIFDLLPQSDWFEEPAEEMVQTAICRKSGHRSSTLCLEVDTIAILKTGVRTEICPYHQAVHLDQRGNRVHGDCESTSKMKHTSWFVLPLVQEYYFKTRNPSYQPLPPFRADCITDQDKTPPMDLIYPQPNSAIFIPRELDGSLGSAIFEVAHRHPETTIYWHLNDELVGTTSRFHQIAVNPGAGEYKLTVVDENGKYLIRSFKVLSK